MGKLYVCGTPIGNLEDVSIRLLKTLRKVDLIACEDTRHTIKLLNRYKIKKRMVSYHEHSGPKQEEYILAELLGGKTVALVTDAGMPGISDPGAGLIRKALISGIDLEVVPGPTAMTAALSISGLDNEGFMFQGFLPARRGQRQRVLRELGQIKNTLVFYEAPHRLLDTLEDMMEIWGNREMAVARELTKIHEEIRRADIASILEHFKHHTPRGEFCLVVAGYQVPVRTVDMDTIIMEVDYLIRGGMGKKEAFLEKAREYNIKKSDIYNYYERNRP